MADQGDLAGLVVVNTRPATRADGLQRALAEAGATVWAVPLLETVPLPLSGPARQCLLDLDRYRWVLVVSPTAAELGLAALDQYWPQWPLGPRWLAVGQGTARVLRDALLAPEVPEQESSEGLLRLPAFADQQPGDRLLVLRGEGGRNLVRDSLRGQGVQVDYLDLYTRRRPADAASTWRALSAHGQPDVVILTSGETLRHWLEVAGQAAAAIPALVISPRLADLARQAGLRALTAASIEPDAIIRTLRAWRNSGNRDIDYGTCAAPRD